MKTKEKLELGWKYLSTILLFVLGVMFIRTSGGGAFKSFPFNKEEGMVFIDDKITDFNLDELDVKVQKEIINGDTVMNVTVNGEEINSSSFLEDANKISWTDENGDKKVVMLEFDIPLKPDAPMKKEKKIIRKRVEKSSK